MQQEVFAGLKKVSFLTHQLDEALLDLATKAKPMTFARQSMIITEGDGTNSLYIILSGKVKIFAMDERGKEVHLMTQGVGSCFGEIALLTDEPRSASVLALEKTVCSVISKSDFIQWLSVHPVVAISLLGVLSDKVRSLTTKVKQLALSNVYERTIRVLNDMAHTEGRAEGEVWVIDNKPTQHELATMVGASREMVNKIMHELVKGGYVVVEEKTLRIEKKFPASW